MSTISKQLTGHAFMPRTLIKKSWMDSAFVGILRRDILLAFRRRSDVATTLFFFVMVASLFPLAGNPEPALLRNLAPMVLWVAALLASMLSLTGLFAADYSDGTLEQMLIAPQSLTVLVLGKVLTHWLVYGLPVVLLAPVLGMQYALTDESLVVLALSLLLGTPSLSLIGAIGAALTLGTRGNGLLLSVIALPLYIPILIFGAGAVVASQGGLNAEPYLSLLGACGLMALLLAPWATAVALRITVE